MGYSSLSVPPTLSQQGFTTYRRVDKRRLEERLHYRRAAHYEVDDRLTGNGRDLGIPESENIVIGRRQKQGRKVQRVSWEVEGQNLPGTTARKLLTDCKAINQYQERRSRVALADNAGLEGERLNAHRQRKNGRLIAFI